MTYYLVYAKAPDHGLPDNIRRKLAASMGQEPAERECSELGNDL